MIGWRRHWHLYVARSGGAEQRWPGRLGGREHGRWLVKNILEAEVGSAQRRGDWQTATTLQRTVQRWLATRRPRRVLAGRDVLELRPCRSGSCEPGPCEPLPGSGGGPSPRLAAGRGLRDPQRHAR